MPRYLKHDDEGWWLDTSPPSGPYPTREVARKERERLRYLENVGRQFMPGEDWMPVVGFESTYEVSSLGRVRRLVSGKGVGAGHLLSIRLSIHGYPVVTLCASGKPKTFAVHILVLSAFRGPRPTHQHQACHNNGVRIESYLDNLRWGTRADNENDKVLHGTTNRGERHGNSRLTTDSVLAIRASNESSSLVAAKYGISARTVRDIRLRRLWRHI